MDFRRVDYLAVDRTGQGVKVEVFLRGGGQGFDHFADLVVRSEGINASHGSRRFSSHLAPFPSVQLGFDVRDEGLEIFAMDQLEGTIEQMIRMRSREVAPDRMRVKQVEVLGVPFRDPVVQGAVVGGWCPVTRICAATACGDAEDRLVERHM